MDFLPSRFVCVGVAAAAGLLIAGGALAAPELIAQRVAPGVYAFIGERDELKPENSGNVVNTGFVVGTRGVVVIDTGPNDAHGEAIIAAIRKITAKPIVLAINTHPHPENVLGNSAFALRDIPILAHRSAIEAMKIRCQTCFDNTMKILGPQAMANTRIVIPGRALATDRAKLLAGGRALKLYHFGWAHTEGDLAVLDVKSGVFFTGDLVYLEQLPHMREGRIRGWIQALKQLRRIPAVKIVPGHGPVSKPARIREFQDYFKQLTALVEREFNAGAGIIELLGRCDLPQFQGWALYAEVHPQNVQHVYYEVEKEYFEK